MSHDTNRRPSLPAELYRPSAAWLGLYFTYSFVLFGGCGYLSYATAVSTWPPVLKIPAVALMALLASNGLHLLGWLAHEGIHLSMVKNKNANMVLGAFAGSVLFFPSVGFGISHWAHHRFTNQAGDPDTVVQARHQTFLRRFFLARIFANRQYFKNAFAVLFRRPLHSTYRMPFSDRALSFFAAVNFGFMALWATMWVRIGIGNLQYVLYAAIVPYLLMIPITGLRVYVEHAGTGSEKFREARTYKSWFYTILLFGNNYHLEHHLYPKVPSYRLPSVHRRLAAEGYYARYQSPVVEGVAAPLRYTSRKYPYPDAGGRLASAGDSEIFQPTEKVVHG